MKIGTVKRNIIILAISNLIIGMIEFIFNIYLSKILGAEGLGLLSLVAPINCIFLSFMTEGVVITISKSSAHLASTKDLEKVSGVIKIATAASFCWSLILVLIIVITAPIIATCVLDDASLIYPIIATCPLLILMSISNILKGHFLGLAKIQIPALINIAEKLLRFPVLYFLIEGLLNKTSFPPITLVFLCYAIGEMQSVLLLLIYYRVQPHAYVSWCQLKTSILSTLIPIIKGSAPICLTQCLLETVNALSQIVVKIRLISAGYTKAEALSLLGKYKGMVFPLMAYPMILVGAICSIVVPQISTLIFSKKPLPARRLIKRSILVSFLIGFTTFIISCFLADKMGAFFYGRDDLDNMIIAGGLCSPLVYCAATTTNLLISIGCESISFRNSLIQQLILLSCLYIFTGIPSLNIYGYFIAIGISNAFLIICNLKNLKRVC